jgi:hypothetical protein
MLLVLLVDMHDLGTGAAGPATAGDRTRRTALLVGRLARHWAPCLRRRGTAQGWERATRLLRLTCPPCVQRDIKSTGMAANTHPPTTACPAQAAARHGNDLNDDLSDRRAGRGKARPARAAWECPPKPSARSLHAKLGQAPRNTPCNATIGQPTKHDSCDDNLQPESRHWPGPNQPVTRKQSPSQKSAQHHSCHGHCHRARSHPSGRQRAPSHPEACARAPPKHLKRAAS